MTLFHLPFGSAFPHLTGSQALPLGPRQALTARAGLSSASFSSLLRPKHRTPGPETPTFPKCSRLRVALLPLLPAPRSGGPPPNTPHAPLTHSHRASQLQPASDSGPRAHSDRLLACPLPAPANHRPAAGRPGSAPTGGACVCVVGGAAPDGPRIG